MCYLYTIFWHLFNCHPEVVFKFYLINLLGLSRKYPAMYYEIRHLLKKIQETLYTRWWCLSPLQSRRLGTSQNPPSVSSTVQSTAKSFVRITITCPIIFSSISSTVWNIFPLKHFSFALSFHLILVFGKVRSRRVPNLGSRGLSHLGHLTFHQKTLHQTGCKRRCIVLTKLPIVSCP